MLEAPQRDALQPAHSGSGIQRLAATRSGLEWRVGAGAVAGPLLIDDDGVGAWPSGCGCKEDRSGLVESDDRGNKDPRTKKTKREEPLF